MTLNPVSTFDRSRMTSSVVIVMNLEYNSMNRRKKTILIPLQRIDDTKCTHIDLDVMRGKEIVDYLNVDSCKFLSNSWTEFAKFNPLRKKSLKGYMW